MSFIKAVQKTRRDWSTTGISLPFGIGIVGASGVHGPTAVRRIARIGVYARQRAKKWLGPTAAEDLGQEVVNEVWARRLRDETYLDGRRRISPYINAMVQNLVNMVLRGESRGHEREALHMEERRTSANSWMDPEAGVADEELADAVLRAVGRLSPALREVMALKVDEELKPGEIAQRLGKDVSTVKKQLAKATAIYREELFALGIPAWRLGRPAGVKAVLAHPAPPSEVKRLGDGERRDGERQDEATAGGAR